MKRLAGAAAAGGAVVGRAFVHRSAALDLDGPTISGFTAAAALDVVAANLEAAAVSATGEAAEILRAQAAMARDPALRAAASANTPRAVVDAGEQFAASLAATGNAYLAARAADVRHICDAAARRLLGVPPPEPPRPTAACVLLADDLSPADTAGLDRSLVLGIATAGGSPTSHTAIVARGLGIPAVVGVRHLLDDVATGALVAVDGDAGLVFIEPDESVVTSVEAAKRRRAAAHERARRRAGTSPVTTIDGRRVEVAANIRGAEELRAALAEGAEAVGLLRTELLYVDRDRPPTEDEQAALFLDLRRLLGTRRLVIRTFDIGSDKQVPFLPVRAEANPEMGVRGVRLAQRHPDLLESQLRAVSAVADLGPTAVMAPMVATVAEAEWFLELVDKYVGRERVETGVMVEVPSAVLLAPELAARVDFFSVGTNDLAQYLMAADRRHPDLVGLHDPFQPAVLRAVAQVSAAAHLRKRRPWVGVCGEAASRPAWALLAVGLGVDELSMQAASVPEVKAAVRGVTAEACRNAAASALECADAATARAVAEDLLMTAAKREG